MIQKLFPAMQAVLLVSCFMIPSSSFSAESDEQFRKAEAYFFQQRFSMAEVLLQEVIKKDPENHLAYSYLGDIFITNNRYDAAINVYRKAVEINPGSAENYFRLGQAYYRKKMGAEAIKYFDMALQMDSGMDIAYYHLGLTYLMLERDKNSTIHNWETFIKKAPEDPQYENIKRVLSLLKEPGFEIPPKGSDITVEEALLLGGQTLTMQERQSQDKKSGDEDRKTIKSTEDILFDEDLE